MASRIVANVTIATAAVTARSRPVWVKNDRRIAVTTLRCCTFKNRTGFDSEAIFSRSLHRAMVDAEPAFLAADRS